MGSWTAARAQLIAQGIMSDADNPFPGTAQVVIYAGTPPARVSAALLPENQVLAQLAMSDPPFLDSPGFLSPGYQITADTITDDASANATGTPTFGRVLNSLGAAVYQFSVGGTGSGKEGIVVPTTITSGQPVAMTSLTITVPEA